MFPGNAPLKRSTGLVTTSNGRSIGCAAPFRFTEPMIVPVAVSPIQMFPFSPPERYTRALSGENVTPMKLALTSMRFATGAALLRSAKSA